MDLEKQTKIIPSAKTASSSNLAGEPTLVSLFDAVRKWTDAEGVNAFYIEIDGASGLPGVRPPQSQWPILRKRARRLGRAKFREKAFHSRNATPKLK